MSTDCNWLSGKELRLSASAIRDNHTRCGKQAKMAVATKILGLRNQGRLHWDHDYYLAFFKTGRVFGSDLFEADTLNRALEHNQFACGYVVFFAMFVVGAVRGIESSTLEDVYFSEHVGIVLISALLCEVLEDAVVSVLSRLGCECFPTTASKERTHPLHIRGVYRDLRDLHVGG